MLTVGIKDNNHVHHLGCKYPGTRKELVSSTNRTRTISEINQALQLARRDIQTGAGRHIYSHDDKKVA
jgi:hypothetical protein